ncbi:MAG: hypothetical protein ABIS47_10735 [Acidimicrobiales bacterium]
MASTDGAGRGARPWWERGRRAPVVLLVIGSVVLSRCPPAAGHAFGVLVVAGSAGAEADRRDGFLLAVQQSPDVSHPPGEEGGDHLGGLDVNVSVFDDDQGEAGGRVRSAIAGGTGIVVALSTSSLGAVAAETVGSDALLVIATGAASDVERPSLVVLPRPTATVPAPRLDRFGADFLAAYGRAPTSTAVAGYDAALLIGRAVEELGEGVNASSDLRLITQRAAGTLLASDLAVGRPAGLPPRAGSSPLPKDVLVLLGIGAVTALGAGLLIRQRRRRPTT